MARSRVVLIRSARLRTPSGGLDPSALQAMLARGFSLLTGSASPAGAAGSIFGPGERIGIKINTIGGRELSTRPELALGLASYLAGAGLKPGRMIIWDRTGRELKSAGYRLQSGPSAPTVIGTDADGAGYDRDLVSHLNIGSMFSAIQTGMVDASISLAVLKDHGLAGITAGMKNYFGAVHNPNKYHESGCDPFVAELFDCPQIKTKHRLTILDCLNVQFHRGPSYHPKWSAGYNGLVLSRDPVAADRVGWKIIEELRASAGLPTLRDEGREPRYLATAEKMGLGAASDAGLEIIEETLR